MAYNFYQKSFSPDGEFRGAVKWLIIGNTAVFVLQNVFGTWFFEIFGLIPYYVTRKFWLWQPVTYMFLHGGFFHIFEYDRGRDLHKGQRISASNKNKKYIISTLKQVCASSGCPVPLYIPAQQEVVENSGTRSNRDSYRKPGPYCHLQLSRTT